MAHIFFYERPGGNAIPSDSVSAAYPLPPGFPSAKHISDSYQDLVSVQDRERIQEADGMQVDSEGPPPTARSTRFTATTRNPGAVHRPSGLKRKRQPIVFDVEDEVNFSQQPIDPRYSAIAGGAQVSEPKSFVHDADYDHMTPAGGFVREDTQPMVDTYDLDEM